MKYSVFRLGVLLLIIGFICLIFKGITPEYIDSDGFLREYFFLLPIGFGSIVSGIILCCISKFVKE